MKPDGPTLNLDKAEWVSNRTIGACIEIHRHLGPGLLESAYEICLAYELTQLGLSYDRQKIIPVHYKTMDLDCGFRMDFVIENEVIVELKSVNQISPVHEAQMLTYLKLSKLHLGLLINFNVGLLKDGIRRMVHGPARLRGLEL